MWEKCNWLRVSASAIEALVGGEDEVCVAGRVKIREGAEKLLSDQWGGIGVGVWVW